MTNATFARLVTLAAGWSKVRVGVRLNCTDLGAGPSSTPRLGIGLCAGTGAILGDTSTTHFAGALTNISGWTRGTLIYLCDFYPATKVGTTLTIGASSFNADTRIDHTAGSATTQRGVYFIDITKGSPNYTFDFFSPASNGFGDVASSTFLGNMVLSTPSISAHSYGTARTLAVDEATNGTLNAACVWWNRSDFLMEICDLAVAVIA